MVFFVVPLKVSLLIWTLLISSTSSDKIKGKSTEASVITNFLRKIVIPYIENNKLLNGKQMEGSADSNTLMAQIEKAIIEKVIKLKPMLQDREHNDNIKIKPENNVKSDDKDKATIVEFVSKNNRKAHSESSFRNTRRETDILNNNIEKYKQIRQHITLLLNQEKTSISTSQLITKTLDDMLALLTERNCQNFNKADIVNYLLKDVRTSGQHKLMCFSRPGKPNIHIYTSYPAEKSAIMKASDKTLDQDKKNKHKNVCDAFLVCAEELTDFLKVTYRQLNQTAVSTFTNYAAMYIRDVKEETKLSTDTVGLQLEHLGNLVENKINQIFLKELEHFTLDENKDKTENIAHIKHFINATITHIKSSVDRIISNTLNAMRSRLFSTIKEDLKVNLKVDVDNLSRLMDTKMCGYFVQCGSQRRTKISNKLQSLRLVDAENDEFEVQRSFDDGLQNSWQEQTFTVPKRHDMEPKKYRNANITRRSADRIGTMEGAFSSENGLTDKFF